jgi:glycosyltransferase involved in cell wall biosynthesis
VKVAVYDQFWPTAGGGEKVAAGIAQVLAADHDVTLVGHDRLDLDDLGERLQLDLTGIGVDVVDLTPTCVEEAVEGYDLLVNASYTSSAVCTARHGLYYVHFPHPTSRDVGGLKGAAVRAVRPVVRTSSLAIEHEEGLHPEELISRRRVRWTTGEASLSLLLPPGDELPLHLELGRVMPMELYPMPVTIEVDGEPVASVELTARSSRFAPAGLPVTVPVRARPDGRHVVVTVRSEPWLPSEVLGSDDRRRLGVPLLSVQLGDAWRSRLVRRYPSLARRPDSLSWLASYDRTLANSGYTREWIQRWWGADGGLDRPPVSVLPPPVTMQPRGDKDRIILNVGRFFDAEQELHLVGGCGGEDRAYLERVRHAAAGLPVHLHVNASGAEVRDLYRRASIYWHASGLGEDPKRHPDRFEHFGITTVEAMSAGAVPIVIGQAGQREVVEHGRSGYHFHSPDQLVELTRLVTGDDVLRRRLGEAAVERAQGYSMEAFAAELRGLVDDVVR